MSHELNNDSGAARKLLQSGVIFTIISFVTSLGHLAFQAVLGRHLSSEGQYGDANSALGGLMALLGLLPAVAVFAITHYIAHFNASGDKARLEGLLRGCRRSLFHFTLAGSVLAVIAVEPLSNFFHYNESLTLMTLGCTLLGLWASLATALCQGLAWFKRLALLGFLGMILRVSCGWFITLKWPSPETAVLASTFVLLPNVILLIWKKDLSLHSEPVSPWNREFAQYFIFSAALVVGNFCFFQSDYLVANKFFTKGELDTYAAAGILARALPMTVAPLLTVLFTSRSGQRAGGIVSGQLKLIGLSFLALAFGAICLFALRTYCLKIIGRYTPEAAAMIGQFAMTMVFVGLLQSLAYWALASRWQKTALLYGGLGLAYWLALLAFGKTPTMLLHTMSAVSGMAFIILFAVWFGIMRRHKPAAQS